MNIVSDRLLTLFDPDNQHEWCDTKFDQRIFIRFTEHPLCFTHINTHVAKDEADVHFFFPDVQLQFIMTWTPEINDTLKYIYCRDQASIDSIKRDYGRRIAHKIFTTDDLDFAISHVEIELLVSLKKQTPENSNERDEIVKAATGKLDGLRHILNQLMTDQPSEEAVERN